MPTIPDEPANVRQFQPSGAPPSVQSTTEYVVQSEINHVTTEHAVTVRGIQNSKKAFENFSRCARLSSTTARESRQVSRFAVRWAALEVRRVNLSPVFSEQSRDYLGQSRQWNYIWILKHLKSIKQLGCRRRFLSQKLTAVNLSQGKFA